MRILKLTILTLVTVVGLLFIFNYIFLKTLHKDAIEFRQDQYSIARMTDLYMMACNDIKYQNSQECKDLEKQIDDTYLRIANNYKFINFYLKYVK